MENKHQPAFPFVAGNQSDPYDRSICEGLSKREYLAAMAMQGLMANGPATFKGNEDQISRMAVKTADALLEILEEESC